MQFSSEDLALSDCEVVKLELDSTLSFQGNTLEGRLKQFGLSLEV